MSVEFLLLGSVEARIGGEPVAVGPARQRCVLAVLLAEANQVVSADQLIERVWGDRAPQRVRGVLRTYLCRLRQVLAGDDELTLGRRAGGYVLTIDPAAVDLHHFHTLLVQARAAADDRQAAELWERALGLWRGEPFAGLDTPWLAALRDTLEAERISVELDYADLRLRSGHHGALLAELANRAAARPLDERLVGQLMLALYRCGRQADALAHYDRLRCQLVDELGADPSVLLRALHQRILTADPALDATAPDVPAVPAGTATSRAGPVSAPVPRQLPATPGCFTGRRSELERLTSALDATDTMAISVIAGAGGIGKTWLALHWAHWHLDRFPDGQLFVDLRGFTPAGAPMSPGSAVRGFLGALGVELGRIPVELEAQVGLYRSLVAGKRMLIVLDNARDAAQVSSLLPGTGTCMVIITSRDRLAGVVTGHGVRPLTLDVLDAPEARGLLAHRLGPARLDAEPDAVAELLAYCAGLPLALGIVAARATAHPDFPLTTLAAELRDTATRLSALDAGDPPTSMSTVLSWSYAALGSAHAEVFGLLGLTPGPDISLPAAANLTNLPVAQARALLRGLEQAHLVQQHTPGRYRMHDLVRLYAADQARDDLPPAARTAGLRRWTDFLLHTAHSAERLLDPNRTPIQLEPPGPGHTPHALPDPAAALAWLDAEHSCLLAAQQLAAAHGWHTTVWQLAWALHTFHRRRGHWHDMLAAWQVGLAVARHGGDPDALVRIHRHLGGACANVGRHADALDHLGQALALARDAGDLLGQANAHRAIAVTWGTQGHDQRALEHAVNALHLYRTLDQPVLEADTLNTVGWYSARLGHYEQASVHCQAALTLSRRHHHGDGEAATLDSLGYLAHRTGQHGKALTYYQQALTLLRDLGDTYNEADTLDHLGQTHATLGDHDQARRAWRQALRLYQAQHRTGDTERTKRQLDQHTTSMRQPQP